MNEVTTTAPATDHQPAYYTAKQIAQRLGLCLRTVKRMVKDGKFPPACISVGRSIRRWNRVKVWQWEAEQRAKSV